MNNHILEETKLVFENEDFKLHSDMNMKCKLNEEGNYYVPRVTALLDTIKEDYLLQWANSLGWKRKSYTTTLQEYAQLGSEVHKEIEDFLKDNYKGRTPGFISFYDWWKKLCNLNDITDIESEVSMMCPYFCGTTDLFFRANGKNVLVDFKTSKNISYKYVAQLSAYSYMMETQYGRKIDYCIILQVDKYEPYLYSAYMYDLHNPQIKTMFDNALNYIFHLACGYMYNQYLQNSFNDSKIDVITRKAEGI